MTSDISGVFGQEYVSPIDIAEGKIRKKVGEFQGLHDKLVKMMVSPILTIQDKAKRLMSTQRLLEKRLDNILDRIEKMKKGAWSFSDVGVITLFATTMERHIKAVNRLWGQYKGVPAVGGGFEFSWKWVLIAGAGLSALYLVKKIF